MKHKLTGDRGLALLMVIWVLTIMMVIILSFSLTIRTNGFSTLAFKEAIRKDFVAQAGVQNAILELLYRSHKTENEEDIWRVDGTAYHEKLGDTEYIIRITDESGKIDINKADEILLRGLLSSLEIREEDADTVVDSILDWRDADDLVRLHGAESEYYESLPKPYKAKNADFDALEELLLVKGVTSELLYGPGDKKKGLIDLLTVYSKDSRININTAPKEVLMALPGMTAEVADTIISTRQTETINDLQAVGGLGAQFVKLGSKGNIFTIEVSVKSGEKPSGYGTKAIVRLDADNKYKILYWKNQAPVTTE